MGKTFIHLCNNIIRLDDSKLKADKDFHINGALVDFTLVKARSTFNGQSTTLVLDFETGYDPDLSLFLMLKQDNRINGSGVGMYFRDRNDMKFSQKNFKEKIESNPELKQLFMEEAVNMLKSIPVEVKTVEVGHDVSQDIIAMINSQLAA